MIKLILYLVGLLLMPHLSKAQQIVQIPIDIIKSEVKWKGTKMRGLGKHEGVVQIKSGYFEVEEGNLYGGRILLDMNSIMVTDIPEHEPVPRRRLNNHLKSDDFFGVDEFPEAEFWIKEIVERREIEIIVEGELTIRDITDRISLSLKLHRENSKIKIITSTFKFDRFNWNIGYEGSWIDRTLVDKEVEINLILEVKN